MKAFAWRNAGALAAFPALVVMALCGYASATAPTPLASGLPQGLPALPSLSQAIPTDMGSAIGLQGFDPVAYRIQNRPIAGRPEHELLYAGIVWRFASAANLFAFRDAPQIYMPAFAGLDPIGITRGAALESDPREFAIVGSRLFMFRSGENRSSFLRDAAMLGLAEAAWPALQRALAY